MLWPMNEYSIIKDYELNRAPAAAERAEQHRQLVEAGLIQPRWITCEICHMLWKFGHLTKAAGQRLEFRYANYQVIQHRRHHA